MSETVRVSWVVETQHYDVYTLSNFIARFLADEQEENGEPFTREEAIDAFHAKCDSGKAWEVEDYLLESSDNHNAADAFLKDELTEASAEDD